jgi:hypothetical protein
MVVEKEWFKERREKVRNSMMLDVEQALFVKMKINFEELPRT